MPFDPTKITRELILQAVEFIEKEQPKLRDSTRFDVYINSKPYPPKEIMAYAHFLLNGEKIWRLAGGKPTNTYLRNFGFKIKRKNYSPTHYYWVCQGSTYELERAQGYLAAKDDQFHHHQSLKDLEAGDHIIHYFNKAIVAVSTVVTPYTPGITPYDDGKGLIVKVKFDELSLPIEMETIREKLHDHPEVLPKVYSPLSKDLVVNQGYLFPFTKEGYELLIGTPGNKEEININQSKQSMDNLPALNTIFYGPPGTGKTYSTMAHALGILGVEQTKMTRKALKAEYDKKRNEGRIVFTSFHQSLSYEDFIEGIKPDVVNETVTYDFKPGIFKSLANKARESYELALKSNKGRNVRVSFELVFEKLKAHVEEGKLTGTLLRIPLQTTHFDISDIVGDSIKLVTSVGGVKNVMTKPTLRNIYENPDEVERFIKGGMQIYYRALLQQLNTYEEEFAKDHISAVVENYVLIIDEINRGPVSQIFGELITLLEEDKRLGRPEALEVKLPYSKDLFGVPPNLYIIGTMNTADRSVEALDTALRRRFEFKELQPDPKLLSPEYRFWSLLWEYQDKNWHDKEYKEKEDFLLHALGATQELRNTRKEIWERMKTEGKSEKQIAYFRSGSFDHLDVKNLLETINERIELLLNRDHLIGHSYFFHVYTEADLKKVIYKNIIPLLQEYFYGDYGKIGLVLGQGFVKMKKDGKVKQGAFAKFDYEDQDLLQKVVYEIVPEEHVNITEAIRLLYEK